MLGGTRTPTTTIAPEISDESILKNRHAADVSDCIIHSGLHRKTSEFAM